MGTKEHAKINYFAEAMDEATAMLHKQQERIEALEAESTKAGQSVVKPIPCGKFRGAPTLEWIAKLVEETGEVIQDVAIFDHADEDGTVDHDSYGLVNVKEHLAMELTDVITVCVSWLDTLGYDELARERLQERVAGTGQ